MPHHEVIYYRCLIDRRKFLLTPLALAFAADAAPNLVLMTPSGWRGQAVPWDGAPDLTAEQVRAFCAGRLAHFKIPRYVHLVDGFPMTVTGKVRKVEMREKSVQIRGLPQ